MLQEIVAHMLLPRTSINFLAFKVLLQRRKTLHFNFSPSGQGCVWDVPGFFGSEIIGEGNLFSDSD
jgi:hypothetical protein